MTTVYKIQIKTISAFKAYSPEQLEKEIKEFLSKKDGLNMESIKIKARRLA